MLLKDIIVHLDRGPGCTARFMAAVDLARRHQACLKGLYVIDHPYYNSQPDLERDYDEMRSFFVNAATKSGVTAEWLFVDWRVVGVSLSEIIAYHAYSADLLIIGQPKERRRFRGGNYELPEQLIRVCGRPVVVFPAASDVYHFGGKILVAWRGGRESTRAIHDALPLLHDSSRIEIITVVSDEEERKRENASLSAIDVHLARYAIEARTTMIDRNGKSVADVLLKRVEEEEADLLVMGGVAYSTRGVPRFTDLAREVMQRMTVPILFSH